MRQITVGQAGLAVLTAAALTWAAAMGQGEKESRSNGIISVDADVLAQAAYRAIEDEPFMKVMDSGGRPKYASEDTFVKNGGTVGVAVYEPVTLALKDWPIDEFMYFLEGHVQISDADGNARTYGPGDAIVMPKGFTGTWKATEPLKKIAVYWQPVESVAAGR